MTVAHTSEQTTHEKAMALGSKMLLKSIYLAKIGQVPPAGAFSWSIPSSGTWSSGLMTREQERAGMRMAQKERARELVVGTREPCIFCGVRGDVGCSHRRTA